MKFNPVRSRVENIELSIRKISEKASEKEECIRLDIGQPSFNTPQHVKDAAKEAMEEHQQGYTATTGIEELRQEIAREESKKAGIQVDPEQVLVTTGGMGAIYATFASVLEEDDTVVLNDPCWGPYKLISEVNGNQWKQTEYFDGDTLTRSAREAIEDAKMAIVNTPSNPAGRVLNGEQAREIAEVAEESDTVLISDEVYHRLMFDKEHVSPAQFTDNSIIIGSVSKNHAMTGWRIGWLVTDEETVGEISKASRAMTASPSSIGQYASVEAIRNDSHVEEMRKEYKERRDLVVKRMDELGWNYTMPEGGIYTFPDVGRDSWDFCLEMIEKGVAMVPGESFGPESDQNVRIAFGSSTKEELEKAFDIIEEEIR